MLLVQKGGFNKPTAVFLASIVVLTAATYAFADEGIDSGKTVVSVYAGLKAKVAVDGETMGFTPVKGLKLAVGAHEFEFTYRDYAPQVYEVEITTGVNDLYFQLEPRLEERTNKFNKIDLIILIGVAAGAVAGFAIWGK